MLGIATRNPATTEEKAGVLYLGWSFENRFGSSPSRLMLIHMRGCPNWKTNSTLAIDITALTAMIPEKPVRFRRANTYASGSPTASSLYGAIPVSTRLITTYNNVEINNDNNMARGRSFCGRLHSSAVVEMASNPI